MDLAKSFKDPSLLLLLFSNVVAIIFAVLFKWSIVDALWLYWYQSVIIGFFTVLKVFTAKINYDDNLVLGIMRYMNRGFVSLEPTLTAIWKLFLGVFFCLHYGAFHFGYALFLTFLGTKAISHQTYFGTLLIVGLFFATHLFSYCYNYIVRKEREMHSAGLQRIFLEPYKRIFPMHLTIMAGVILIASVGSAWELVLLVFFLSLKTIMDLIMHSREHAKTKSI